MNFWDSFASFLFAFIIKDFYDIFIQDHIKKWLQKSRFFLRWTGHETINILEKKET